MLISIGILAWNEEERIATTLTSLLRQSVFSGKAVGFTNTEWEIIVVPNGCSDNTAKVSKMVLADLCKEKQELIISWGVYDIEEAGKSNAWNRYIHEFSSAAADFTVMLDADIEFGEQETIENTVNALLQNPDADVAVDQPLKDAIKKSKRSLIERMSLAVSISTNKGAPSISGQFYCARSRVLRTIWIPKGLPGEDGFLRSMILTNCFRDELDTGKVVRAANATHYFETLTSLSSIFRHEVRIVIGTALNCYLTWDFLKFATDPTGPGAGVLIRNNLEKNTSWYLDLIDNSIKNRGVWVLPRGVLLRRFQGISGGGGLLSLNLKKAVVAISAFLFDLPILIAANSKLKKGSAIGYW